MQLSPEADQQAADALENPSAQIVSGALPECDVSEQTGKKARRGGFSLPAGKEKRLVAFGLRPSVKESGSDQL